MARFNVRFMSKALLRKTEVNVIIPSLDLHGALSNKNPQYYREGGKKYPLILLLSGFGDDGEGWILNSEISSLCDEYGVAAAMIGGENKWYLDFSATDNFHAYISEELPDFLYGNFALLDRHIKPVIGGVSMGGYGALYNLLKSPANYSAAMALSPAVKPDDIIDESKYGTLKELFSAANGKLPPLYLAVGDKDFIYRPSCEFNEWLKANVAGASYRFVEGYGHSWDLWRLEIKNFLDMLRDKKII